jgi:hypothetical protein
MIERRTETDFLKWLIGFGDPEQCADLRERIHHVQREEYYVRRLMILMCVLLLISLSGLGYALVFVPDWLGRTLPWMVRIFCALGLSSALSFAGCLVCWWRRHLRLEALHNECREVVRTLLLTRLNGVTNVDAPDYRPATYSPPQTPQPLPVAS